MNLLAPDADKALHKLRSATEEAGGKLYVTEVYRSWMTQDKAHKDYLSGRKKAFVAPAGESFHQAGRAIDIDLTGLRGLASESGNTLLDFWNIAMKLGWRPIIGSPDAWASEAWHFEYPGDDWKYMVDFAPNKVAAKSAIYDTGQQDPMDSPQAAMVKFVQSQCNRLIGMAPGLLWLEVDGRLGPMTQKFAYNLTGRNISNIENLAADLSAMSNKSIV